MNTVVNEVLRFKSKINGGFRLALKDLPLKGGAIIPEGATFRSHFASNNFNEEYWDANATGFDPERFLQFKDGGAELMHNFVTFGRGARICPGEQLVKLVLRVFAARIAQKYTFGIKDQHEVALPLNVILSNFKVVKL